MAKNAKKVASKVAKAPVKTITDLMLEVLVPGKQVSPEEINDHVGRGPYASKYISKLRSLGYEIDSIKEGRKVAFYVLMSDGSTEEDDEDVVSEDVESEDDAEVGPDEDVDFDEDGEDEDFPDVFIDDESEDRVQFDGPSVDEDFDSGVYQDREVDVNKLIA